MQMNPIIEPMFIPMIAPRYTPKTPILSTIPSRYAKSMLKINSLKTVRTRDLNPEPMPW